MAKNKNKKPGILKEFKTFITRGNVIDMATGVIVASAFTKIVTSLTNNVFLPLVNYLVYLMTGGKEVLLITVLNGQPYFLESTDDAGNIIKTINRIISLLISWHSNNRIICQCLIGRVIYYLQYRWTATWRTYYWISFTI